MGATGRRDVPALMRTGITCGSRSSESWVPPLAQDIALYLNFLDLAHVVPVIAITRATAQAYLVVLPVGSSLRPGKTVGAAQERHNPINQSEEGEHIGSISAQV